MFIQSVLSLLPNLFILPIFVTEVIYINNIMQSWEIWVQKKRSVSIETKLNVLVRLNAREILKITAI